MNSLQTRFTILTKKLPAKEGCWSKYRVEIFDKEQQGKKIGEYVRNYSMSRDTFFPFFLHNRWWALYSKDYTATRIMTLPECEDWCGEEEDSNGFCPTDYFVPCFREITKTFKDANAVEQSYKVTRWNEDAIEPTNLGELAYTDIGFIAGCVWGDDTSWKVELLDLKRLPEKIFKREARFGYIELPDSLKLKEAIDFSYYENGWINFTIQKSFHLETGETE